MQIWCAFFMLSSLVMPLGTNAQTINACLDPADNAYTCNSGSTILLNGCGLTNDDLGDLTTCFNTLGRSSIEFLDFDGNMLTTLPDGFLSGLTSLEDLILIDNQLDVLPADAFQGLSSLITLDLDGNMLTSLPDDVFADLTSLEDLFLNDNQLATLPDDVFQGLTELVALDLFGNVLTSLPDGVFSGLTSLEELNLNENALETLPADAFQGLTSLIDLLLNDNKLELLPVGAFVGLTSLETLAFKKNLLTTLPAGIFDDLTSLDELTINEVASTARTNVLQCLPDLSSSPTVESETPTGSCECVLAGVTDAVAVELLCGVEMTCASGTAGYTCDTPGGNGDPHMVGFSGQKFDFTGKDGSWYTLLKDELAHINMRVSAPVRDLDRVTYITGISLMVADFGGEKHTMLIYVEHPDAMDSACPVGVSPCLANGALRVLLDGVELVSPGEVTLGPGVSFGAVNLPGECRPFGFEKYWERKVREAEEAAADHGRRLQESSRVSMPEWILSDRLATNKPECEVYVEEAAEDLFVHQSEHVSFQLNTPTFTMRLNYGKLHQVAIRDPTDQFDVPDHLTHQMNLGLSRVILGDSPEGVLGETTAVRTDMHGVPIMTGMAAIPGDEEDYKVDGAFGTAFKQAS